MQEKCFDIFNEYDLPFETYFASCINHDDIQHDELEIIWVVRGNAKITCNGKDYVMTSQTVFLVYMNHLHSVHSEQGSIIISYRLKKSYLHKNNLFFEKIPFIERVYSFEELSLKYRQVPLLIVQIVKLLLSEEKKDFVRYKIIGYYNMYIFELYSMLLKEKYLDVKSIDYDEYLNRIHLIVEYTYEHFNEKISLEDLSNLTNISTFRLSHFIKDALGISYRQFLMHSRFEHALKLLKETKLSVIEIAEKCGFSDHKYLNKMMKLRYNLTPLKYRKLILERIRNSKLSTETYDFLQEDVRFKNLFEIKNFQL
jgi:AraC-like DNA-binding protein